MPGLPDIFVRCMAEDIHQCKHLLSISDDEGVQHDGRSKRLRINTVNGRRRKQLRHITGQIMIPLTRQQDLYKGVTQKLMTLLITLPRSLGTRCLRLQSEHGTVGDKAFQRRSDLAHIDGLT